MRRSINIPLSATKYLVHLPHFPTWPPFLMQRNNLAPSKEFNSITRTKREHESIHTQAEPLSRRESVRPMFSSICRILCISFLYCINYTVAQRSLRGTAGCGQITTICMADLDSVWFGSSSWRTLGASIDQRNPCVVRSLISHSSRYGAWLRNAPIPEAVLRKRCRRGSPPSARQIALGSQGIGPAIHGCGAQLRRWVRDGVQLRHEGKLRASPSVPSVLSVPLLARCFRSNIINSFRFRFRAFPLGGNRVIGRGCLPQVERG